MITRGKWLAGILGVIAVVYQVGARTILALPAWTSLVVVSLVSYALISLHKRETIQPGLKEIHGLHALSFTSTSAWSAHLTRKSWEEKTRSTPLYKLASDKTNSVVDKIFALIKSSFILPWYSRISPSPAFPNAVDILIRQVLVDLVDRSESVDWATLSVSKILPRLTDHVHHFRSVEHLSSTSTPQPKESLPLPLPRNPHPAIARQAHMSSGGQLPPIEAHFRSMVSRVLESVLPESGKSNVVQTMVREVVLGSVLLPCFELLCDADFWNRQFEERGGRYLHEQ
jgi:sorting nexin-25